MFDRIVRGVRSLLPSGPTNALAEGADTPGGIDLLTAGYPCQPFSTAARGRNSAVDLWPEALRVIQSARPRWVILENVPGARLEHIERSCRALEDCDYAVWPLDVAVEIRNHVRRRIWVVAHDNRQGQPQLAEHVEVAGLREVAARRWCVPFAVGVDDGLPQRMDRMRSLGNSIEPDIAELLIRAIATETPSG